MDFAAMKRRELQALCKRHGLATGGSNADLVVRLAATLSGCGGAEEQEVGLVVGKGCLKRSAGGASGGGSDAAKKVTFVLEEEAEVEAVVRVRGRPRRRPQVVSSPVVAKTRGRRKAGEAVPGALKSGGERRRTRAQVGGDSGGEGDAGEASTDALVRWSRRNAVNLGAGDGVERIDGAVSLNNSSKVEEEVGDVGEAAGRKRKTRENDVEDVHVSDQVGVSRRSTRSSGLLSGPAAALSPVVEKKRGRRKAGGVKEQTSVKEQPAEVQDWGRTLRSGLVVVGPVSPNVAESKGSTRKEQEEEPGLQKVAKVEISGRTTRSSSVAAAVMLPAVAENKRRRKREDVHSDGELPAVPEVPINAAPVARILRNRTVQLNDNMVEETQYGKKLEHKSQPIRPSTRSHGHQHLASSIEEKYQEQVAAPCKGPQLRRSKRNHSEADKSLLNNNATSESNNWSRAPVDDNGLRITWLSTLIAAKDGVEDGMAKADRHLEFKKRNTRSGRAKLDRSGGEIPFSDSGGKASAIEMQAEVLEPARRSRRKSAVPTLLEQGAKGIGGSMRGQEFQNAKDGDVEKRTTVKEPVRQSTRKSVVPAVLEKERKDLTTKIIPDAHVRRSTRKSVVPAMLDKERVGLTVEVIPEAHVRQSTRKSIVPAILENERKGIPAEMNPDAHVIVRRSMQKSIVPSMLNNENNDHGEMQSAKVGDATKQLGVEKPVKRLTRKSFATAVFEKKNKGLHKELQSEAPVRRSVRKSVAPNVLDKEKEDHSEMVRTEESGVRTRNSQTRLQFAVQNDGLRRMAHKSSKQAISQLQSKPISSKGRPAKRRRTTASEEVIPVEEPTADDMVIQEATKDGDIDTHGYTEVSSCCIQEIRQVDATGEESSSAPLPGTLFAETCRIQTVNEETHEPGSGDCIYTSQQDNENEGLTKSSHEEEHVASGGFLEAASCMEEETNSQEVSCKDDENKVPVHYINSLCEKTDGNRPAEHASCISDTLLSSSLIAPANGNDVLPGSDLSQFESTEFLDELIGCSNTEVPQQGPKEQCEVRKDDQVAYGARTRDLIEVATAKDLESVVLPFSAEGKSNSRDAQPNSKREGTEVVESGNSCDKDVGNILEFGSVVNSVVKRTPSDSSLLEGSSMDHCQQHELLNGMLVEESPQESAMCLGDSDLGPGGTIEKPLLDLAILNSNVGALSGEAAHSVKNDSGRCSLKSQTLTHWATFSTEISVDMPSGMSGAAPIEGSKSEKTLPPPIETLALLDEQPNPELEGDEFMEHNLRCDKDTSDIFGAGSVEQNISHLHEDCHMDPIQQQELPNDLSAPKSPEESAICEDESVLRSGICQTIGQMFTDQISRKDRKEECNEQNEDQLTPGILASNVSEPALIGGSESEVALLLTAETSALPDEQLNAKLESSEQQSVSCNKDISKISDTGSVGDTNLSVMKDSFMDPCHDQESPKDMLAPKSTEEPAACLDDSFSGSAGICQTSGRRHVDEISTNLLSFKISSTVKGSYIAMDTPHSAKQGGNLSQSAIALLRNRENTPARTDSLNLSTDHSVAKDSSRQVLQSISGGLRDLGLGADNPDNKLAMEQDKQDDVQVQEGMHKDMSGTLEKTALALATPESKHECVPEEAVLHSMKNERCSSSAEQSPFGLQSLFSQESIEEPMEYGALALTRVQAENGVDESKDCNVEYRVEKTPLPEPVSDHDTNIDFSVVSKSGDCVYTSQQDNENEELTKAYHEQEQVASGQLDILEAANCMKEDTDSEDLAYKDKENKKHVHSIDINSSCEKIDSNGPVDHVSVISDALLSSSPVAPTDGNDKVRPSSNPYQLESTDFLDEPIGCSNTEVLQRGLKEQCDEHKEDQVAYGARISTMIEADTAKDLESGVPPHPAEERSNLRDVQLTSKLEGMDVVESDLSCDKNVSNILEFGSIVNSDDKRIPSDSSLPKDPSMDHYQQQELLNDFSVENYPEESAPSEEAAYPMKNDAERCSPNLKQSPIGLQFLFLQETMEESHVHDDLVLPRAENEDDSDARHVEWQVQNFVSSEPDSHQGSHEDLNRVEEYGGCMFSSQLDNEQEVFSNSSHKRDCVTSAQLDSSEDLHHMERDIITEEVICKDEEKREFIPSLDTDTPHEKSHTSEPAEHASAVSEAPFYSSRGTPIFAEVNVSSNELESLDALDNHTAFSNSEVLDLDHREKCKEHNEDQVSPGIDACGMSEGAPIEGSESGIVLLPAAGTSALPDEQLITLPDAETSALPDEQPNPELEGFEFVEYNFSCDKDASDT